MVQFRQAFQQAGFHWSCTVIWAKDRFTLSRADMHPQHEPILYGWPEGADLVHHPLSLLKWAGVEGDERDHCLPMQRLRHERRGRCRPKDDRQRQVVGRRGHDVSHEVQRLPGACDRLR